MLGLCSPVHAEVVRMSEVFLAKRLIYCITEDAARDYQTFLMLRTDDLKRAFLESSSGLEQKLNRSCFIYEDEKQPASASFESLPIRHLEGSRLIRGKLYMDKTHTEYFEVFFITSHDVAAAN